MQNTVNVGIVANDGKGDTLRQSFIKINDDVTELYSNVANLWIDMTTFNDQINVLEGVLYTQVGQSNDLANAAHDTAGYAANVANTTKAIANTVNSAWNLANAAYNYANSTVVRTNAIYVLSNSSFTVANAAFDRANTLNDFAFSIRSNVVAAFDMANLSFILAGEAYDMANAGVALAAGAVINAASAYNFANGVSVNAAAAYRVANSAYGVTNVAYGAANAAFFKTNTSYAVANSAYDNSNTKVNTVNGIATGTFNVQGIHRVDGNVAVYGTTNRFEIINGRIYINGILWDPMPVAAVIYSASQTVPHGYLYANGDEVSRSTYSDLFALIGTTYGPGNGSTTFNLPDLRGEFIRGHDDGKGLDSGRGFGSYQGDGVGPIGLYDPGHQHHYDRFNGGYGYAGSYGVPLTVNADHNSDTLTSSSTTGISITGLIAETRPKNVALKPFIKY